MKIHRRGILLISILILTLVATFFLGALIQLNPGRLRQTVHDEKRDQAAMAARAGVDYALNRFKSDIEWKADANTEVVRTDELVIREDRGNVLGWIKTDEGQWAGFRIRFNFQDGNGGGDGLSDPIYPIRSAEISLNNLSHSVDRPLYKGTGTNYQPDEGELAIRVPEKTVAILSEGVVSSGLDPSDPEGLAQTTSGTTRAVEGIYAISSVAEGLSSDSLVSSMEIDIEVMAGHQLSLKSYSDNIARVRSKGGFKLHSSAGDSKSENLFDPDEDAEVLTHSSDPFAALTSGESFAGGVESPDNAFLKINFDSVSSSDQSDPLKIPGGVYIFTEGDQDDTGRTIEDNVKYFDMTWEEYRNGMINGPAPVPEPNLPPDFAGLDIQLDVARPGVDGKRDVITIKGDVNIVDSASGKKDISIIPERGARQKAGEDPVEEEQYPELNPQQTSAAIATLSAGNGVLSQAKSVMPQASYTARATGGGMVNYDGQAPWGLGVVDFYNDLRNGSAVTIQVLNPTTQNNVKAHLEQLYPGISVVADPTGLTINPNGNGVALLGGGTVQGSDPLYIPRKPGGSTNPDDPNYNDETVPQDIELTFEPDGVESAFIRSEGDIFLGTHLSGTGGGVIAKGNVDLVGFGVDIEALASQPTDETGKASLAIFSGESASKGINISTYDERLNKYWDVNVDGAIFSEKNIFVRLGEDPLTAGENPPWGAFDYKGAIIALGDANTLDANWTPPGSHTPGFWGAVGVPGTTKMIVKSMDAQYDPRFLAPFLEEETLSPTFAAVSVVER